MPTLEEEITSSPEGLRVWNQERLIVDITERLCQLMKEQGIGRADLAKLAEKSPAHVTQLLGGGANMTIRTVSDLFFALGRAVQISDCALDESPTLSFEFTNCWQRSPHIWPNVTINHININLPASAIR